MTSTKYKLAKYPQAKYRFRLFDNVQRYKTTDEVLRAHPGAVGAINLWYFSLSSQPSAGVKYWDHQAAVMICGVWGRKPTYAWPGLCIDVDGRATVGYNKDATYDYAASVQADYIDGKRANTTAWGRNGVTYTGFTADGALVAMVCSKDSGMTSAEAVQVMRDNGCITILRWDGSWSSQGQLMPGVAVKPSQNRSVRGWLIIYPREGQKEEDKPVGKKVCLDAGHGIETAGKCAPDKSYYEHEFNLDMVKRKKTILERHGVEVFLTRTDEHDVSLERRVQIANAIKGLDLFVSDHSNASGDGKAWTSPDGYGIYTSAAGATANRNIAANKALTRAKEAGIKLWDNHGLFHSALYVCKNVVAPAILIEHGFHTNRAETALLKTDAYRQKLAVVDCKGILDYLGVQWQDDPAKPTEKPKDEPWYAEDQVWAKDMGISDGTRPEENITRAEVWAMLHRMK